jgi:hypothetical protein
MPQFFARVELHSAAAYADYVKLHTEMAKQGFQRVIKGSNGNTYNLPTGSYYNHLSFLSRAQALDACVKAAQSTGFASTAIVVESVGVSWSI